MTVRTFDPRPPEIYPPPKCSEDGCGQLYSSICKQCNLAFCFDHLKLKPHSCRDNSKPYIEQPQSKADALKTKPNGKKKSGKAQIRKIVPG